MNVPGGAFLPELLRTARARARAIINEPLADAQATFERRLREARALAEASDGLSTRMPELSARMGASTGQRLAGWLIVAAYVGLLFWNTSLAAQAAMTVIGLVFAAVIGIRLTAAVRGILRPLTPQSAAIADVDLPVLTILIPLYREASVLGALLESMSALDYPADKLDVKLLLEFDDDETLRAAQAAEVPAFVELIPVPPGGPRTKPKALNYGLAFARGDLVAVFDAEDRPAPDQPRAAAAAFLNGDHRLAVVQAPLAIHNGKDGWLSAQFEIEYAIHFKVWLPLLAAMRAPLALGGTSNYFRRDILTASGGWDAWNVTEDADVGLRLARLGYRAGMIAPPTEEEAPVRFRTWLNQRTRWLKGHLQTWLVLNRQPIKAARGMGLLNFLLAQLTLGGALLAAMVHAPLLAWMGWNLVTGSRVEIWHGLLFCLAYGSTLAAALASRARQARPWMLLTQPFYWPLQSLAMVRAFIEMKLKPFHWAKTPHGETRGRLPATQHPPGPPAAQLDNVVQLEFPFAREDERAPAP